MPVPVLLLILRKKKKITENLKKDFAQSAEFYHYIYHSVTNIIIIIPIRI